MTELAWWLLDSNVEFARNGCSSISYCDHRNNHHPMSRLDDLLPWNWRPLNTFTEARVWSGRLRTAGKRPGNVHKR